MTPSPAERRREILRQRTEELAAWHTFVESCSGDGGLDWGADDDDMRFFGLLGLIYDRDLAPEFEGSREALGEVFAHMKASDQVEERIDLFMRARIDKPAERASEDLLLELAAKITHQFAASTSEPHRSQLTELPIDYGAHGGPNDPFTAPAQIVPVTQAYRDLAQKVRGDLFQDEGKYSRHWLSPPAGKAAIFQWPSGGGALEMYFESLVTEGSPGNYDSFFDLHMAGGTLWLMEDRLIVLDYLAYRHAGKVLWTDEEPVGLEHGVELA